MNISTFKYYFFIFHFTIKNELIDTGSSYSMPVDMSIVPHPRARGTMDICWIFLKLISK